jgi:hypothetical protein
MLSSLFALCRRLHQPMRLAVVVTPLALVACCALAVHALGSIQQSSIQTPAITPHGDSSISESSVGRLKAVSAASDDIDRTINRASKTVSLWSKPQLARRITERWTPDLSVSLRASSFERSLIAGLTMPMVFDASSPEYLTLRQLRL